MIQNFTKIENLLYATLMTRQQTRCMNIFQDVLNKLNLSQIQRELIYRSKFKYHEPKIFRYQSQDIDEEDKDEESEQEETILDSKQTIILLNNLKTLKFDTNT